MYCRSSPDLACLGGEARTLPSALTVAVDTEYLGVHTLTVQAAARLDVDTLAVQVYRSTAVPGLPAAFDPDSYLPPETYGPFCRRVIVRPVRPLTPDLSPMRMVKDLLGLPGLECLTRQEGRARIEQLGRPGDDPAGASVPDGVEWSPRRQRWTVPALRLTLVGHFLTADFCRIHGREFLAGLLADAVEIRKKKLIAFAEKGRRQSEPVLGYCSWPGGLCEVRVQTRDTILPFGHASLDSLSRTFLGRGKCDALTDRDKENMLGTFRRRTADAYGYAMADAVNTLLVYEQMGQRDRDIYRAFGFAGEEAPPLRATLGSRVSTFLLRATRREAGGSEALASERALEDLMRRGGMELFRRHPDASRYGEQTGKVHGGLLFSRSPTRFWHEAPGMLRDVDMAACYQSIVAGMNVYWGRPVIYEPGDRPLTLKEAVDIASRAAPPDGWYVRVSGDLDGPPNALIPSSDDAVTTHNYRSRLRHGRRRQGRRAAFHLESLKDPGSVKGTGGSRLYSSRIESGVVTAATWLMIRALPSTLKCAYERLTADSIVLYPRKLVAAGGDEFDALVERHRTEGLPWDETLDLEGLELVHREKLDAEFVALQFPVGDFARRIGEFRKEAQAREGKGSGTDLAWKVHANSMYGVLACSRLPTGNMVAANVVTAQARAGAFAMSLALNAIQTITDGCTYRLDQVPAVPLAECLRLRPDYPVRRAEEGDGIPFLDPAAVPTDDDAFTEWYRGHLNSFLETDGPEYEALFGTHRLEHKRTSVSRSAAFDALACDGAGNYLKCVRGEGGWAAEDFAARSFRKESKESLRDWIVSAYSLDRMEGLAPLAEDHELLSFDQARREARKALLSGLAEIVFPLGLEHARVANYRVVKPSAFVFRTPEQRARILKQLQRFEARTGCGLEVLSLRRAYRGRRRGSLADLAEELYRLIHEGGDNLAAALNLRKLSPELAALAEGRVREICRRKGEAERRLLEAIDAHGMDPASLVTALVLAVDDFELVGRSGSGLGLVA